MPDRCRQQGSMYQRVATLCLGERIMGHFLPGVELTSDTL
jgi:hypothetical protein